MRVAYRTIMSAPLMLGSAVILSTAHAGTAREDCKNLPSHAQLQAQLDAAVAGDNGGLGNDIWATIVDRDGIVCQVAFSGEQLGDQWPGSRVISAQKANTAKAFSLEGVYPNASAIGVRRLPVISTGWCWNRVSCSESSLPIRSTRPWRTRARRKDSASRMIR
jgi:hypothetical protein